MEFEGSDCRQYLSLNIINIFIYSTHTLTCIDWMEIWIHTKYIMNLIHEFCKISCNKDFIHNWGCSSSTYLFLLLLSLLPYPRSPNGNSSSLLGQFKIHQPECMLSISVFPIFFFFRTTARVSLVLLPLLGISWVFGVFAVNDDTVVFQYIFTISNSIQVWNQEELADRKNLHCCIGRWVI